MVLLLEKKHLEDEGQLSLFMSRKRQPYVNLVF
jgi:hypothetical protein